MKYIIILMCGIFISCTTTSISGYSNFREYTVLCGINMYKVYGTYPSFYKDRGCTIYMEKLR